MSNSIVEQKTIIVVVLSSISNCIAGITKRMLNGFKHGTLNNHKARWSISQCNEVTTFLEKCKLPSEINRPVRGLDELPHWKATEYRSFLLYLSIVVVKKFFTDRKIFQHYLLYYCAVVICTRRDQCQANYNVAEKMFLDFLINFKALYGIDHFSSNLHNLCHLVDDVRKFGPLDTMSAYPFESKLFFIKRLLRNGKLPLSQVAKRISELLNISRKRKTAPFEFKYETKNFDLTDASLLTFLNEQNAKIYSEVDFPNFKFNADTEKDRWFLSNTKQVVCVKYIIKTSQNDSNFYLYGSSLKTVTDYFDYPVRSSELYIYESDCVTNSGNFFSASDIYCKMVRVDYDHEKSIFIPLYETIKAKTQN